MVPDVSFENMQVAFRIAGALAEQDIALSYYNGRADSTALTTTRATSPASGATRTTPPSASRDCSGQR